MLRRASSAGEGVVARPSGRVAPSRCSGIWSGGLLLADELEEADAEVERGVGTGL
jgi:hypothetical protein